MGKIIQYIMAHMGKVFQAVGYTADPRVHETPDYVSGFRFPDHESRLSQLMYQKGNQYGNVEI